MRIEGVDRGRPYDCPRPATHDPHAPRERDLLVFAADLMLGSTIPYSRELRLDEC